ncbi:DUF6624 domain-containing protein [Niabella beijingensis]|uniref:DUF6624 domain-containing protein n=1 Tax=Niabella beijingensis TaxID=2872700 RepID=UPI001CBC9909|nr:DUF6624 domain-containing protein [Niabella beijingensis]MBZ4191129.1 hypothetical protein [Niabella beijingensis]
MKKRYCFIATLLICISTAAQEKTYNAALANELAAMVKTDQIAAKPPAGAYKDLDKADWQHFKDSVFQTHKKRLAVIYRDHGYPGYDLVGKEGAFNFWLMVQHCDFDPAFQQQVLEGMRQQVDKKNAPADKYGWLTDRVNLNTGKPQIYGSQVTYNTDSCQAYPKNLYDSVHVNKRRALLGMEPLEAYLNAMSEIHFEMNRESYMKQGITGPKRYPQNKQ